MESMMTQQGTCGRGRVSPAANGYGPILELRRQLGITQYQLAQEIGFSLRGVAQLEKQGRVPVNAQIREQLVPLAQRISSPTHRQAILEALQSRTRRRD